MPHVGGPILPPGCPTLHDRLSAGRARRRYGRCASAPPDVIALGSFTVMIGGDARGSHGRYDSARRRHRDRLSYGYGRLTLMKNLRRVVWSRGMFLTPPTFSDHSTILLKTRLQFRFSASNFCNWGVVDMAMDQEALANGLFTLHHCRGVLPDGVVFSIPETDAPPSGRPVAENFTPTQDSLDVFLALPERRVEGKNVTQPADNQPGGAVTRFVAETLEVLDENGYGDSKSVQSAPRISACCSGTRISMALSPYASPA